MIRVRLLLFLLVVLILPASAMADIAVIVNANSGITALTHHQIIDIYMGRNPGQMNGQTLQPHDQAIDSRIRADFYYSITGKPVSAINAYWARLLFTGRASPPKLAIDNAEMLDIVEKNPGAIGYLDTSYLNEQVTVVYRISIEDRK